MALSADQRATLQLLLERGQGYADIARVLGIEEMEVRARARAALAEIAGSDPDRNVALSDYLLGQADPIGRADAVRHLQVDRGDHQLAAGIVAELRRLFPEAKLPRLPGEQRPGLLGGRSRAAPGDAGARPRRPRTGLSPKQARIVIGAAAAAVVLVAAVLGITGAFGGGGEGSETTAPAEGDAADAGEELERVELRPRGGGDASGEAVFGLATGDQPFVDVSITGLNPAPQGQTYVIWLMLTQGKGYPLSPIQVTQQGAFDDRFAIPSPVLPIVARVRYVDVAIAPVEEVARAVRTAIRDQQLVLDEPGRVVLRGTIPRPSGGAPGAGS